jgi:very-short-patch-repair endonuclease
MATDLSRKLRRQATPAELTFWKLTQTWRQQGWHFCRQFQLGSYYVDFVCIAAGLVVEIDGDTHGTDLAISNDAVRDDYLRGRGFTVLRFSNQDVLTNAEGVFSRVAAHLEIGAPVPPPPPSPRGGGSRAGVFDKTVPQAGSGSLPLAGRVGVGGATNSISSREDQK